MKICQNRHSCAGAVAPSVIERVVGDGRRDGKDGWIGWRKLVDLGQYSSCHSTLVGTTYPVVRVYGRDPPTMPVLADPLSSKLFAGIVQFPTVELPFRRRRLVRKRIELVNAPALAGPCLYIFVDIACLRLVFEIEADKHKIATSDADCGRLAGDRGSRAVDTEGNDRE